MHRRSQKLLGARGQKLNKNCQQYYVKIADMGREGSKMGKNHARPKLHQPEKKVNWIFPISRECNESMNTCPAKMMISKPLFPPSRLSVRPSVGHTSALHHVNSSRGPISVILGAPEPRVFVCLFGPWILRSSDGSSLRDITSSPSEVCSRRSVIGFPDWRRFQTGLTLPGRWYCLGIGRDPTASSILTPQ